MRDGSEESPMMVLQEAASVSDFIGTKEQQKEKRVSSIKTVSPAPSIHPHQQPVSYPQRLA